MGKSIKNYGKNQNRDRKCLKKIAKENGLKNSRKLTKNIHEKISRNFNEKLQGNFNKKLQGNMKRRKK